MNDQSRYRRWHRVILMLALVSAGACNLDGEALTPRSAPPSPSENSYVFASIPPLLPADQESWRCFAFTVPEAPGTEVWLESMAAVAGRTVLQIEVMQPGGSGDEVDGAGDELGVPCDASSTKYGERLATLIPVKGKLLAPSAGCVFSAAAYKLHGGDRLWIRVHYLNLYGSDAVVYFNVVDRPFKEAKTFTLASLSRDPLLEGSTRAVDVQYPPLKDDITIVAGWAAAFTSTPLTTQVQLDVIDPQGNRTTLTDHNAATAGAPACGLVTRVAAGSTLDLGCTFVNDGAPCDPSAATTCQTECSARIFYVDNNQLLR